MPPPPAPELLAPAGSIESFHAAIEAGADAVYLGLGEFNARLRAKNFSMKTLSYLVPFAHSRKVKLYVTLNTLVKQAELEPLVHTLFQLEQIGVDAVIVADLGLIDIARARFPKLRLHASTQMTIHNSVGVRQAEMLNIRRVILSRELTLEEITQIRRKASVEVEIFVHGALCYGISGLCLASSFLGGSSGNRGRCTQVCRRKFKTAATAGYFFSPDDLCALDFLPQIKAAGVHSLKIEGRMKGPDYVYPVVKAWRMALDNTDNLPAAKELAATGLGRPATAFFLGGAHNPGIIDAREQPGTGRLLGKVIAVQRDGIIVDADATVALFANDRIRIQPQDGFEGESASVQQATPGESGLSIVLKKSVACSAGDTVYLTGRQDSGTAFERMRGVSGVVPAPFTSACPSAGSIVASYRSEIAAAKGQRETLWIKIDDLSWLDHLHATPCQRLVLAVDRKDTESLLGDAIRFKTWRSRLVIAPPPFIAEREFPLWRALIDRLKKAGIATGMCSNIGHRRLFGDGWALFADAPFGCLNRASRKALHAMGFSLVTRSIEDDYLNIKASAAPDDIVCLFAAVPLFISRIHPAVRPGVPLTDPHDNRFFTAEVHGLHYLLAQKPLCLTHRRKKLSELGVRNFLVDLCFTRVDPDYLQKVIGCFRDGTRMPDTSAFNFKAGLK
jgi:putative protease